MLEIWDKDYYLSQIKDTYLNQVTPSEDTYQMLNFLVTFAVGTRKMGLNELADRFNDRVDLFYTGLHSLGFRIKNKRKSSEFGNIINRVAYGVDTKD